MQSLDPAWNAIKREIDAACAEIARTTRRQITRELNQSLRRIRQYGTEAEWVSAVLDAAAQFAEKIALLAVNNGILTVRGEYKLNLPENLSFPVASAGAFAGAIETKDPIIALRTPSEVSEALSVPNGERAHVMPIINGSRVVAVLFAADQDSTDVNGLELIAGIASAVLERRANTSLHAQIAAPVSIAQNEAPPSAAAAPDRVVPRTPGVRGPNEPSWTDLTEEERNLHIRARRFSRVTIAEMQLGRPEACRAGREQANLYLFLQQEIDRARETYRKQFMTTSSMLDYLHIELVRTAAQGEELKLGAEYPGQLV